MIHNTMESQTTTPILKFLNKNTLENTYISFPSTVHRLTDSGPILDASYVNSGFFELSSQPSNNSDCNSKTL